VARRESALGKEREEGLSQTQGARCLAKKKFQVGRNGIGGGAPLGEATSTSKRWRTKKTDLERDPSHLRTPRGERVSAIRGSSG